MKNLVAGVLGLLFNGLVLAEASEDGHLLVQPYEGVEKISDERFDYGEYQMITGFDFLNKQPVGKKISGKITRLYYSNPKDHSVTEVFSHYKETLTKKGFQETWSCDGDDQCFTSDTRASFKNFNGFKGIYGGESRYAAGELTYQGQKFYVAFGVGRRGTSIDIIESNETIDDPAVLSVRYLKENIETFGHAQIDGLHFAHDSDELLDKSKPALVALATLLKENPDLEVFVVGHTDMTGELIYSLNLSKRRAQAVVNAMIENYEIDRSRLSAKGVGPLSPLAPNSSELGRAKNRRVEIVAM